MSTPNTTNEVRYKTGGYTDGTYPIPFPFRAAETIYVFHYDVETSTTAATVDVDYTLVMQDSSGTVDPLIDGTPAEKGYIKWINSTAPKDYIVIRRVETPKQETTFDHSSGLDATAIEGATDRTVQSSNLSLKREAGAPDVYDANGLKIHNIKTVPQSLGDGVDKKFVDDSSGLVLSEIPAHPLGAGYWLGVSDVLGTPTARWDRDAQLPTYSGSEPGFDVLKKTGGSYSFSNEPLVPSPAGISRGFTYTDSNTVSWNTFSEVPGLTAGETDDVLSNNADYVKWRTSHESPLTGTAAGKPLCWNQNTQSLFWDNSWSYGVEELSIESAESQTTNVDVHHHTRRWEQHIAHNLGYQPSMYFGMIQTEKIDAVLHVNNDKTPTFAFMCHPRFTWETSQFTVITKLLNMGGGGYGPSGSDYTGPIHWTTNSLTIKFHWWARQ